MLELECSRILLLFTAVLSATFKLRWNTLYQPMHKTVVKVEVFGQLVRFYHCTTV